MVTSYMWEKTVKQIEDLEQENEKLRDALEAIIDMAGCCTGEDAVNMLDTAEYAIYLITRGEGE